MRICKNINPNIFREYDIRGIYDTDIDEDVAYTIGRAFASYVRKKGNNTVIVGHDNRKSHEVLFPALIKGLTKSGVNVIDLGLVTTPMCYFAKILCNVESAIMLTASHNPKEYNGFKMSLRKDDSLYGVELKKFESFLRKYNYYEGKGEVLNFDIKDDYLKLLKNSINLGPRKIRAVIDLGNGTGSDFIKDILDMFDIEYKLLYAESNSDFPNHVPDPAVKENMEELGKTVKSLGYDVGLAVDGDCDRCGVVLENGNYIPADLMMLIFYRCMAKDMKNKKAIFDVKCSKTLIDEVEKLHLEPIMNRTGGVFLRKTIKDLDLDFGGEYSGHIFFRDKYLGYDDGIYGLLRFIELLSNTDKKASELLNGINEYHSTEEIKIPISDDKKFGIINEVEKYVKKKKYKYLDIDGIRVTFDDVWALIRASNSGPHLILRFEASTLERLEEIKKEFMERVHIIINKSGLVVHNNAKKADIAKTVIMPGDPLRAKYIAKTFLEDYKLVNRVRGMYAYTGFYKGKKITVMAHGMGMASIGIYAYELFNMYDVDNIIRIGSCGSYDKDLKLFDLILCEDVYSESNYALTFNNEDCHLINSSETLNKKILDTAKKENIKILKGNTICTDCFDVYMMDQDKFLDRVPKHIKPLAAEMEAFALFYIARILDKNASCILSVVDSKFITEVATSEEREKGLDQMIKLALETAVSLKD